LWVRDAGLQVVVHGSFAGMVCPCVANQRSAGCPSPASGGAGTPVGALWAAAHERGAGSDTMCRERSGSATAL
jgi:hypothetical protein